VPGARLRRGTWRLPPGTTADLDRALDRGQLTLRGYDRVLRLAWSIADVEGRAVPTRGDLGTALTLRTHTTAAA
jgi:magnesium chelatase family protein